HFHADSNDIDHTERDALRPRDRPHETSQTPIPPRGQPLHDLRRPAPPTVENESYAHPKNKLRRLCLGEEARPPEAQAGESPARGICDLEKPTPSSSVACHWSRVTHNLFKCFYETSAFIERAGASVPPFVLILRSLGSATRAKSNICKIGRAHV